MFIRTFLRIMFHHIFCNNVFITFGQTLVNFCNNLREKKQNPLKFSTNMTIIEKDTNTPISFRSITGDEIDYNNVKTC